MNNLKNELQQELDFLNKEFGNGNLSTEEFLDRMEDLERRLEENNLENLLGRIQEKSSGDGLEIAKQNNFFRSNSSLHDEFNRMFE